MKIKGVLFKVKFLQQENRYNYIVIKEFMKLFIKLMINIVFREREREYSRFFLGVNIDG